MGEVLSTRLLETIREELGGTYSISASANYWKTPRPEYTVSVSFGCDPTRTDALIKRVFEEIEKYKTSGPTEKQLNDEKEALLKEYDANMKNNAYLLSQIKGKYEYGEDPATLLNIPEYYRNLTGAAIQQAAKTYLNPGSYVQVVMVPEKK